MPKLLTRTEAAALLGISLPTLDLERKQGKLAFIQSRENGKVWLTEESINKYLDDMTKKAHPVRTKNVEPIRRIRG